MGTKKMNIRIQMLRRMKSPFHYNCRVEVKLNRKWRKLLQKNFQYVRKIINVYANLRYKLIILIVSKEENLFSLDIIENSLTILQNEFWDFPQHKESLSHQKPFWWSTALNRCSRRYSRNCIHNDNFKQYLGEAKLFCRYI